MNGIVLVIKGIGVALAAFSMFASPAAFTPAVFVSFVLMVIAGICAMFDHLIFAVLILFFTSISIGISPISENLLGSMSRTMFALIPFLFGYGGVIVGVWRSRNHAIRS